MTKCQFIHRRKRKSTIGDMDRRVIIHNRNISAPDQGGVDFGETFTEDTEVWANVNTVSGETFFDDTNIEHVVTHKIVIRWMPDLTSEQWIELLPNGDLLDILPTENLDERNEFIMLKCTKRGTKDKVVNEL